PQHTHCRCARPFTIQVFFFQAEDGIRDGHVTGVQTCALPISPPELQPSRDEPRPDVARVIPRGLELRWGTEALSRAGRSYRTLRSEERRVGKECRSGCGGWLAKKKRGR